MSNFSRNIQKYEEKPATVSQKVALFLVIVAALTVLYFYPIFLLLFLLYGILTIVYSYKHAKQLSRISNNRSSESICSFTRALNFRHIDTWIIRATWEELQFYVTHKTLSEFPIRPTDKLEGDFRIDPEELEDIAERIVQRTRRSLEETDKNPYFGKIETVGDLILFVNNQPNKFAV